MYLAINEKSCQSILEHQLLLNSLSLTLEFQLLHSPDYIALIKWKCT